jgi:thioredoxin 1
MANQHVLELTDANFRTEVLESPMPVLVDFWGDYCAPCKALAPTIDAIGADLAGKVKVGKVNISNNPGVAGQYQIMSIPTLMVFVNGKPVKGMLGVQRKETILAAIDEASKAVNAA